VLGSGSNFVTLRKAPQNRAMYFDKVDFDINDTVTMNNSETHQRGVQTWYSPNSQWITKGWIRFRHPNETMNVLFFGGHVARISKGKTLSVIGNTKWYDKLDP